ncbi:MAG: tetratricopeptide (TPR) repeat protein, partial [Saprospiraceae bacterium]
MFKINVKIFFLFFVLTFVSATSYSQTKEENQLIKTGEKYFENGEFSKAVKIYGQLIGANSQNPDYNYKYGACLIHTAKKKTDALPYLKYAVKNQTEVSEAHFYLGRAYHISYHFAEAIGYYKKFKSSIKEKEVKKYQLDLLISECERAKEIIKNFKQVKVLKSKKLKKSQFFRGYDLGKLNRKILVKPDEFKTNED